MPKYNPNSIWTSKKRPARYAPEEPAAKPPRASSSAAPARPAPSAAAGMPAEQDAAEEGAGRGRPVSADAFYDDEDAPKSHLFLWAITIFVAVIGAGTFLILYFRPPASPNVGITFAKPDQVLVGDEFELDISPSNYSSNILKHAVLSISLPSALVFSGQPAGERVMQESLGDLGPGSVTPQRVDLVATGGQNSVQRVDVTLSYGTDAAPNASYKTGSSADVVVGGPAISLSMTGPQAVYSGQNFQFTATYENNTSHAFDGVTLALSYPPSFNFAGASMAPADSANDSWNIGTIPPAGTGSITISGSITGAEGGAPAVSGTLSGGTQGNTYVLSTSTAALAIGKSPLSLSISLSGAQGDVVHPGDRLTYTVAYANNSSVTFDNVDIQAALTGGLYDLASVETDGYLDSQSGTITWTPASDGALLHLAPGASGTVTFKVNTGASYSRTATDETLGVSATISSATLPPGVSASSTVSSALIENKVGGKIALSADGFWKDPSSSILNSGPYPPQVSQATEYTIHWVVDDYGTDADNVAVSATLQSGTTCTGMIASNMSTAPVCDPATGQVTWDIPLVLAGSPAEAVFQVENTPSSNQVGSDVTLLSDTSLVATDGFTSSTLDAQAPAVTTALPDDTSLPSSASRTVTQ